MKNNYKLKKYLHKLENATSINKSDLYYEKYKQYKFPQIVVDNKLNATITHLYDTSKNPTTEVSSVDSKLPDELKDIQTQLNIFVANKQKNENITHIIS